MKKRVEELKSSRVEELEKVQPFNSSTIQPCNRKISDFLRKHHLATLATSSNNTPWVAHCFYAFLEKEMCLVFTTDSKTRHGKEMIENSQVSVGIAWETKIVGQIRGAQCSGQVLKVEKSKGENGKMVKGDLFTPLPFHPFTLSPFSLFPAAKAAYLKRFPYAVLMKTELWILVIDSIKYTDNRLGFGKKLFWERKT